MAAWPDQSQVSRQSDARSTRKKLWLWIALAALVGAVAATIIQTPVVQSYMPWHKTEIPKLPQESIPNAPGPDNSQTVAPPLPVDPDQAKKK